MSEEESPGDQARQLVKAVFEFMEEIRPKGGIFGTDPAGNGPPYVHRLGVTHGPAFTVREMLPRWEPPRPQFGMPLLSFGQFPVKGEPPEIPEAFRRR